MSEFNAFRTQLSTSPETVEFDQVIALIEAKYTYTPTAFANGSVQNDAGTNEGSCKLFAFGLWNDLTPEQMLACFGKYYREDVLAHPEGTDHANIRNFMRSGWAGVVFEGNALQPK